MKAGDLVLFDYAPDFHYYTSDVTRMFPASGKFTADQRELYGIYVKLYQAIMTSIRPAWRRRDPEGRRQEDGRGDGFATRSATRRIATPRHVSSSGYRTRLASAARRADARAHGRHGSARRAEELHRLRAGDGLHHRAGADHPEDRVYIRLEDMIVITPNGYENMSGFAPIEIDAIEKLMAEPGMAQLLRKPTSIDGLQVGRVFRRADRVCASPASRLSRGGLCREAGRRAAAAGSPAAAARRRSRHDRLHAARRAGRRRRLWLGPGPVLRFAALHLLPRRVPSPSAAVRHRPGLQIALGTAAVGFVFVGGRVVRPPRGWMAAMLAALTGLFTFHEVLLLQAALDPFLTAAALAALALADHRSSRLVG